MGKKESWNAWYLKNREARKAKQREYYYRTREKRLEWQRNWHQRNREQRLQYHRDWYNRKRSEEQPKTARPKAPKLVVNEQYLIAIEEFTEWCARRRQPFKCSMMQAMKTFMDKDKDVRPDGSTTSGA